MKIIETGIPGLLEIQPELFRDSRGYFCEVYNEKRYRDAGIFCEFCQENFSKSRYGVIRGLHYQMPPYSQAKLASCPDGIIWDVAVDLRRGSPTYGEWRGVLLDSEKKNQFLIPRGLAHGFAVLSETACFSYRCDNFYQPEAEGGIAYDDPILAIDWRVPVDKRILSEKDSHWQSFKDYGKNPMFSFE